jgi:ankyrin repeat protein
MDPREGIFLEAAASDNLRVIEQLLQTGVNINSQHRINQWTALHWATYRGHATIVEFLLSRGADATRRNAKGQTPIDLISSAAIRALYQRTLREKTRFTRRSSRWTG